MRSWTYEKLRAHWDDVDHKSRQSVRHQQDRQILADLSHDHFGKGCSNNSRTYLIEIASSEDGPGPRGWRSAESDGVHGSRAYEKPHRVGDFIASKAFTQRESVI